MILQFERHLKESNLAENTVTSYLFAVKQYYKRHESVTKKNIKEHKAWLIEKLLISASELSIATWNISGKIRGHYLQLKFNKKPSLKM